MNCFDVQKSVHIHLDGEFAEAERAEIGAHLKACAACRRLVGREGAFVATIRDKAPMVAVPTDFAARITAALAAEPVPVEWKTPAPATRLKRFVPMIGFAAAALLIAGVVAFIASSAGRDENERVADEAIASHTRTPPLEVRGSSQHVHHYLEANVPFEVDLPFRESEEVQLVGARLTRVDGRDAVILHYRVDDEPMTVVQVASDGAAPRVDAGIVLAEPRIRSENGFDVVTLRRKGVVSSFVGSGRDGRIPRLVQAAWRP